MSDTDTGCPAANCSPLGLLTEGALCALSAVRAMLLEQAQQMPYGKNRRRIMSLRSEVGLMMDGVEGKAAVSTITFELVLSLAVKSGMKSQSEIGRAHV